MLATLHMCCKSYTNVLWGDSDGALCEILAKFGTMLHT